MGLHASVYWMSHYVTAYIKMILMMVCVTIIMCFVHFDSSAGAITAHSNALLIFVFLLCYASAIAWFAFAVATIMKTGRGGWRVRDTDCAAARAAAATLFVWLLTFVPFLVVLDTYDSLTFTYKLVMSLALNSCLGNGMRILAMLETQGIARPAVHSIHFIQATACNGGR